MLWAFLGSFESFRVVWGVLAEFVDSRELYLLFVVWGLLMF